MAKSATERTREYRARLRSRQPAKVKIQSKTPAERSRVYRARKKALKTLEMNGVFLPEVPITVKQEMVDEEDSSGPSASNSSLKLSSEVIQSSNKSTRRGSRKSLRRTPFNCFYCGRRCSKKNLATAKIPSEMLPSGVTEGKKTNEEILCSTCILQSSTRTTTPPHAPPDSIFLETPGAPQTEVDEDSFAFISSEISFEESKDDLRRLIENQQILPDEDPLRPVSPEMSFEDNKDEVRKLIAEQSISSMPWMEDNKEDIRKMIVGQSPAEFDISQLENSSVEKDVKPLTLDKLYSIIHKPETLKQTLQFSEIMELANDHQKILLMQVVNSLVTTTCTPFEIFFTCPVKSGRTFVISLLMEIYNRYASTSGDCNVYSTCLSTRKPTMAINGTKAVHMALKISLPRILSLLDDVARQYRTIFQFVQVIVIDEVSIISEEILVQIEARMKEATGNLRDHLGGMDVILVGDLWQVPSGSTAFIGQFFRPKANSKKWRGLKFYEVHRVLRGANAIFASAVAKIGGGERLDETELNLLESRFFPRDEIYRLCHPGFRIFSADDHFSVYEYDERHSRKIVYSELSRVVSVNRLYVLTTDERSLFHHGRTIGLSMASPAAESRRLFLNRRFTMNNVVLDFLERCRLLPLSIHCRFLKEKANGESKETVVLKALLLSDNSGQNNETLDVPNFDSVVRFQSEAVEAPRIYVSQNKNKPVRVVIGHMEISLLRVGSLSIDSSEIGEICIAECCLDNGQIILNVNLHVRPPQAIDAVITFLHRALFAYSIKGAQLLDAELDRIPMILRGNFNLNFGIDETQPLLDFLFYAFNLVMDNYWTETDAVFSRYLNRLTARLFVSYYSCKKCSVKSSDVLMNISE